MAIHAQTPVSGVLEIHDAASIVQVIVRTGGAGQEADSAVQLGKQGLGHYSNSFQIELGVAGDLDGMILKLASVIEDLSEEHNDLSYSIEVRAGNDRFHEARARSVPHHHDGISIMAFISLLVL